MFKIRSAQMSMCNVTDSSVRVCAFFSADETFFPPQSSFWRELQYVLETLESLHVSMSSYFSISRHKQQLTLRLQTVLTQLTIDLETTPTRYFIRILLQRTSYSLHGLFNNILLNNSGSELYMLILPAFIHA